MHQGTRTVFDERLNAEASLGGLVLYTSLEHTDFLSNAHQLGLQAVITTPATRGYYTLEVRLQQSADGRSWLDKNTSPELSGLLDLAMGAGDRSLIGGESWPTLPRLRFVRLSIAVTTSGVSPPASRLQLFATARTRTRVAPEPVLPPTRPAQPTRREAMSRLLGMSPSTLREVETQLRGARPGETFDQVTSRLSPAALGDLQRVTRIVRNLDPDQKRAVLTFANALASLALLPPETPRTSVP